MRKIDIEKIKLTKYEREIEAAINRGEYKSSSKEEFEHIAAIIKAYRKDKVLNIRINSMDLESLKEKAHKLGVKYQTFITQILHRVAQG